MHKAFSLALTFATPLLLATAAFYTLSPFFLIGCSDEIHASTDSPDGKYTVTTFHRDCGATTSLVTHVNIQKKYHGKFHPGRGATLAVLGRREIVSVKWKSPTSLLLTYPSTSLISKQSSWNDITIEHSHEAHNASR